MITMMIKVNMNQEIVDVSGANLLGYADGELLGQQIETIIPMQHRGGHHAGFNRFHSTGVKKILGTWLELPGVTKTGEEKVMKFVLTEETDPDGSRHIIALAR